MEQDRYKISIWLTEDLRVDFYPSRAKWYLLNIDDDSSYEVDSQTVSVLLVRDFKMVKLV